MCGSDVDRHLELGTVVRALSPLRMEPGGADQSCGTKGCLLQSPGSLGQQYDDVSLFPVIKDVGAIRAHCPAPTHLGSSTVSFIGGSSFDRKLYFR
ncbi:hypothetical protein SVIOM74S_01356 [Streptomyces violarus]